MFISSCGATVSAVLGALSLNAAGNNYLMVFCGGLIILAVYALFALIVKLTGVKTLTKIFPPAIIGAVTIVIGLNLAKFLVTYLGQGGAAFVPTDVSSILMVVVAIITMVITALVSHYGKGFIKNIPFLFGLAGGYIVALIFTLTGAAKLIDFSAFNNITYYPDLTFLK